MSTRRTTGLWPVAGSDTPPDTGRARAYRFQPILTPLRYIVLVTNEAGRFIGELHPWGQVESVIWRVNEHGTASMRLSARILEEAPELVEYGNRVVILFADDAARPWAGIIDPPRTIQNGELIITMYSGEYLTTYWETPAELIYEGPGARPATAIWIDLLRLGATEWVEAIDDRPTSAYLTVTFTFQSLQAAVARLAELDEKFFWYFEPTAHRPPAYLRFRLRMFSEWNHDLSATVALVEGVNFTEIEEMEQGPIYNVVTVAPSGADFSNAVGLVTVSDDVSIGRFGARRTPRVLSDVEDGDSAALRQNAAALLAVSKSPTRRIRGRALNLPPGRSNAFWLGDRVTVETTRTGRVRGIVKSLEYEAASRTLNVVLDLQ